MKPHLTAAVVLLSTALVPATHAMPPTVRRILGTIEAVDLSQYRLVIRSDSDTKPLHLAFDRRTTIWRGSDKATVGALARGQQVQVSCRLPFFGPDYASRIVLLSPNKTNKPKPSDHK